MRAERLTDGRARLRCDCAAAAAEGWCDHQVDVLCGRYAGLGDAGPDLPFEIEDATLGTTLAGAAFALDCARDDYQASLSAFDARRRAGLDGFKVETVRAAAVELAERAETLADAIAAFRRAVSA